MPHKSYLLYNKNNNKKYHCINIKVNSKLTWRITRAGLKATSMPLSTFWFSSQLRILLTSFCFTWKLSQFRTADSNKILIEYGNRPENTYTHKNLNNGVNESYQSLTIFMVQSRQIEILVLLAIDFQRLQKVTVRICAYNLQVRRRRVKQMP